MFRSIKNIEVGKAYLNGRGALIEIVERCEQNSYAGPKDYYLDKKGSRYYPDGLSLSGNDLRHLTDKAQVVQVGEAYDYHWPDKQSVGHYKVTQLNERGYMIIWSNGAQININYGAPLNYDAVKVDIFLFDEKLSTYPIHRSDTDPYVFTNGWSACREYCRVVFNGIETFANGQWVLRNEKGELVDMDKHSGDLLDAHHLQEISLSAFSDKQWSRGVWRHRSSGLEDGWW